MKNNAFEYYFKNIDYHLQSGKGIAVFNDDNDLFSGFLTQAKATDYKLVVFRSSNYLRDGNFPKIDEKIDFVVFRIARYVFADLF